MRPAVSAPRSARISASSISSIIASSSGRLATTCAMAPPRADELRLSPEARRCHQGAVVVVVWAIPSSIAVSAGRDGACACTVVVGVVRDSGSTMPPEVITAEEMVSRLLCRDGLMLVVDKPAGIAVHRGPKGGDSLEDHFRALRFGLPPPPALAHRLDPVASGCLVPGPHRKTMAQLGKLFKSGAIGKCYWAVVEG